MPAGYKHGDTPKKAMVRGTISYLESQGLPVNKTAIFRHFEMSRSQGYAALAAPAQRRQDPAWEETRGRPNKVSDADQRAMERLLWDARYEMSGLTWGGLSREANIELTCNPRTLHRAMGTIAYRRCLGCPRAWVHRRHRDRRLEYARRMLEARPESSDWRPVRFSGELHFGFGLDGRVRIVPRPGERWCPACDNSGTGIEKVAGVGAGSVSGSDSGAEPSASSTSASAPWSRDLRRTHAWAAAGYGFKSELIFYEESTSPNCAGVMAMRDYCDKVLDKVVKPWLVHPGPAAFILEEDADAFAHGSNSKANIAQEWKDIHGLRCHFNCFESPDLSPLDALWPPRKQWIAGAPADMDADAEADGDLDETAATATAPTPGPIDWEDKTLRRLAREAWEALPQESIDVWVDAMPQRLRQVIETDGGLVPW